MRKLLTISLLVFMFAALVATSAYARSEKITIRGEVASVTADTLVVETISAPFTVTFPDDMDVSFLEVGDQVLVKAVPAEDDTWVAVLIRELNVDPGDGDNPTGGSRDNSAFCADGKQDRPHPLATKLAERYEVSEEAVMTYFCEGFSMGAITLAIRTSLKDGMTLTWQQILEERGSGKSWGQIWKDLHLVGSDRDPKTPPGLQKKPFHPGKNK